MEAHKRAEMTEADQKIRFVISMFRILAWPFTVLFVPCAILMCAAIIYFPLVDSKFPIDAGLLMAVLSALLAAIPVSMLLIAGRLRRGDPHAKKWAILISIILLFIAFPISTFAGCFS